MCARSYFFGILISARMARFQETFASDDQTSIRLNFMHKCPLILCKRALIPMGFLFLRGWPDSRRLRPPMIKLM